MILCLVAIACVVVFLHLPKRQSEMPWKQQLARIDILGALLLVSAIFSLLFGLDRGNNLSWSNPLAIGSLCATIPLSIAFLVVETRFAHEPFTPAHIIFNRALFACYSQNFFGFAAFTSFTIYLPMFFQVILNMTPVLAGLSLIPAAISVVFGSIIGGMVLKRTGRFYWLAVCSSTMAALGSIFIVVAPSLDRGSLISILIGSVVSFVPQGTTMISSLISISMSSTSILSSVHSLTIPSIQCLRSRPSRSHRLRLSIPISRRSHWGLPSRRTHSKRPTNKPLRLSRSSRSQPTPQRHCPKLRIHQGPAPSAS